MGRRACSLVFAVVAALFMALPATALGAPAPAGRIVNVGTYPVFELGGRPFFVNGAAFFYERIPHSEWRADLLALRELGINTLDLYVIWNWHEPADGVFDFDGHTNPRRDLRGLLGMARDLGFAVIVRPGPVVRNEWRNGGYPRWLLERPEYGMPLHDLLEGRYPPTATLQNAHSDDAAAEWMHNATHVRFARRWLERAMNIIAESGVPVVGVALDDDQGAYIDNQTWPAPHLAAYLRWLQGVVGRFTSAPAFINTYEMKVTASAPVWAMGDWYQSDAYSIGEHDRAQLEFSTGLLQTQDKGPVMLSEFQAGWLEQPDDVLPRGADRTNTLLAGSTLLGLGLHGIVNFPAQDTIYPAGWEAPFANSFYAWDAALSVDRTRQPRALPTQRIGGLVRTFGSLLAATHVAADAAIAYVTSAYDPSRVDAYAVGTIAARTMQAQDACGRASLACDLVDLRFALPTVLRRYPVVFVPVPSRGLDVSHMTERVRAGLVRYVRGGGTLVVVRGDLSEPAIDRALAHARHVRNVDRFPGATLLRSDGSGAGFLVAANYDPAHVLSASHVSVAVAGGRARLPDMSIAPRDALLVPIDIPLRAFSGVFATADRLVSSSCPFSGADPSDRGVTFRIDALSAPCDASFAIGGTRRTLQIAAPSTIAVDRGGPVTVEPLRTAPPSPARSVAQDDSIPVRADVDVRFAAVPDVPKDHVSIYQADLYDDGYAPVVLQNDVVRLVISPAAGARAFVFEDLQTRRSCFTTVGALRDDVAILPPLSSTDRIAKYTHQFPAGTFNRAYTVNSLAVNGETATARLEYGAPDVLPNGAHFERTIALAQHMHAFSVDEDATFPGSGSLASAQRAVSITSLAVGNPRDMSTQVTLTPEPRSFSAGARMKATSYVLGFYDRVTGELATIAWRSGDVENATLEDRPDSVVAYLTLARGRVAHSRYAYEHARSLAEAQRLLTQDEAAAQSP